MIRAVTQDEQDHLLLKQSTARIYFNRSLFRRAHNMRIRTFFQHKIKSCGRVVNLYENERLLRAAQEPCPLA